MSPEVSGKVWEGTGRVPELPGARFWFRPIFGYEEGPRVRRLLRLETEEGLRVRRCLIFMTDDCSSALHGGPPPRPPPFICTLFHTDRHPLMHRSGSARGRHGLGRAVTCHSAAGMLLLKHPQRPAGSIPAQADARQGHLHGRALLPSQGLGKVRRASCHCNLLPWLHPCLLASRVSHTNGIVLFSLGAYPAGVSFLPRSPGRRRGGSKVQNSIVAFIRSFRFRAFRWTLRA